MAVGRRKRFASTSLSNVSGTLYTAPTAPSDGSAAATVMLRLVNTVTTTVHTATIIVGGVKVFSNSLAGVNVSNGANGFVDNAVSLGPFDLMGGETVVGQADAAGVIDVLIYGVEAKDA